jgi:hypothetical protein
MGHQTVRSSFPTDCRDLVNNPSAEWLHTALQQGQYQLGDVYVD